MVFRRKFPEMVARGRRRTGVLPQRPPHSRLGPQRAAWGQRPHGAPPSGRPTPHGEERLLGCWNEGLNLPAAVLPGGRARGSPACPAGAPSPGTSTAAGGGGHQSPRTGQAGVGGEGRLGMAGPVRPAASPPGPEAVHPPPARSPRPWSPPAATGRLLEWSPRSQGPSGHSQGPCSVP